jgi:predicted SpoU family rRNA methylase
MKRIATLVTMVALAFGSIAVASPAQACVGVRCQVECIKSLVENVGGPVVCND